MNYQRLSRVLNALSHLGSAAESIAVRADVEVLEAYAALGILRRRGLAEGRIVGERMPEVRFFLPAGISEPQTQLLLYLGEHGSASAPELAAKLGRPDGEVRTDLFILRVAGRLQEAAGAWQLPTAMAARTAEAITDILNRKAKICESKAK